MKKIYTAPKTPAVSNFKNSCAFYRHPFIKALSLVSAAVLLSNASPVFASPKFLNNASTSIATVKAFSKDGNSAYIPSSFPSTNSAPVGISPRGDIAVSLKGKDNAIGINVGGEGSENLNTFDFTVKGQPLELKGIKDGAILENSNAAVNGGQIHALGSDISNILGVGGYDEEGKWKADGVTKINSTTIDGHGSIAITEGGVSVVDALNNTATSLGNVGKNLLFVSQNALLRQVDEKKGEFFDVSRDGAEEGKRITSKITGLREGSLDVNSTDAVTGGQLRGVKDDLDGKVKGINEDVTKLQGDVQGLQGDVTKLQDDVHAVEKKVDLAVSYDVDEQGNKISKITLGGIDGGEPVMLSNVKDIEIKEGSKEAVNGGTLYNYIEEQKGIILNDAKSYTDVKFEALSYDVKNVRKEARQAAAIGLAVSNLRYFDDPGSLSVSFGGGLWRGQSAFAIGAGYTSEDGKIRSNVSASSSGGQWGVGGGVTLKLR